MTQGSFPSGSWTCYFVQYNPATSVCVCVCEKLIYRMHHDNPSPLSLRKNSKRIQITSEIKSSFLKNSPRVGVATSFFSSLLYCFFLGDLKVKPLSCDSCSSLSTPQFILALAGVKSSTFPRRWSELGTAGCHSQSWVPAPFRSSSEC